MFNLAMQAAPGAAPPSAGFIELVPFILIILIFYFLIFRPQNQRVKKHRAMLEAVQRGDTVVTNGGLVGKVTKVTDDELTVDLGGTVKVKVVRSMIADVRGVKPANDTDTSKKKK